MEVTIVFLFGMFSMFLIYESYSFLKYKFHTPKMLEMKKERLILKRQLENLKVEIGKEIRKNELEMLKIIFYDKTGQCWEDQPEYMEFRVINGIKESTDERNGIEIRPR